jgi:hypothetical protein
VNGLGPDAELQEEIAHVVCDEMDAFGHSDSHGCCDVAEN